MSVVDTSARCQQCSRIRTNRPAYLSLILANRGATCCYLAGYPQVTLFDVSGHELPFSYRDTGDQMVTNSPPRRVDMDHGATGYVTINKYRCDSSDQGAAHSVEVRLPDEATPLRGTLPSSAIGLGYCGPGDPGSAISVSPVGATLADTLMR